MLQCKVFASANAEDTEARRRSSLFLLVELYGADFDSRLGGQLILGQAGCLEALLPAWALFHLSMTIWANLSSEAS